MKTTTTLAIVLSILALLGVATTAYATVIQTGFEGFVGHNAEVIGNSIFGLSFSTTAGTDTFFCDINAQIPGGHAWNSITSDNGKVSGDGEYFISGDVAAYVLDGAMKIELTGGQRASQFSVGVSSFFDVFLEAYDHTGTIIGGPNAIATGHPNTKTQPAGNPGTGLQYLTVTSPASSIAYVLVRSEPGYYVVDNVSATVPEPASLVTLAASFIGLVGVVRRRRR